MITIKSQKARRVAVGITLRELSERTGISFGGVAKCLRQGRLPSNQHLRRIWCSALHIDPATGNLLPLPGAK